MSDGVSVAVHYKLGHTLKFQYAPADMYCPNCGSKETWVESSGGDYYVGPTFVCTNCVADFTLQGPSDASDESKQVIEQIRAARVRRKA